MVDTKRRNLIHQDRIIPLRESRYYLKIQSTKSFQALLLPVKDLIKRTACSFLKLLDKDSISQLPSKIQHRHLQLIKINNDLTLNYEQSVNAEREIRNRLKLIFYTKPYPFILSLVNNSYKPINQTHCLKMWDGIYNSVNSLEAIKEKKNLYFKNYFYF